MTLRIFEWKHMLSFARKNDPYEAIERISRGVDLLLLCCPIPVMFYPRSTKLAAQSVLLYLLLFCHLRHANVEFL